MTLIAGIKCEGGVVLCADSEETAGVAKYSTEKLDVYEQEWCRMGIAGAGNYGDLIDTVVDNIKQGLDRDKPTTFDKVRESLRRTLILVHENEVRTFPSSRPEETIVELLIAVRPREEENADLWATSAAALHPVRGGYDVRGIGEVVRYVAKRLYRENLSLMQGVLLSVHLLSLSKHYLTNIGGDSQILVLTSAGWILKEPVKETELSETFLEYFDTVLSNLFLAYADTSLTEQQFDEKLSSFNELTKKLRKELCAQFTKHHLGWSMTDPMYVGDAYRKLPEGAELMFGPIRADYSFFDHITVNDPDVRVNPGSPRHKGSKPMPTFKGKVVAKKMGRKKRG